MSDEKRFTAADLEAAYYEGWWSRGEITGEAGVSFYRDDWRNSDTKRKADRNATNPETE